MKNTAKATVYGMRAGRAYSLASLSFLGVNLGLAPATQQELKALATRYRALGFAVVGIPAYDCADSIVVLFSDALPPKVSEVAAWRTYRAMTRVVMTYELARAAAADHANRLMYKGGRKAWNEDDYNACCDEFSRLWPWADRAGTIPVDMCQ